MNDTVKQVIVMRNDLGMRKGKMIAQGSHASISFLTRKLQSNRKMTDVEFAERLKEDKRRYREKKKLERKTNLAN